MGISAPQTMSKINSYEDYFFASLHKINKKINKKKVVACQLGMTYETALHCLLNSPCAVA